MDALNRLAQNEADLLQRARRFDQDALACIYQTHHAAIYRYIYHHLGDVQVAQDLASEVFHRFLKALRSAGGPDTQLKAWLYRVAHNLVVDELRSRTRRNAPSLDGPLAEVLQDQGPGPEESARNAIAGAHLREALHRLTPEQRQVLVCKFLEGMSNEEIAEITGKTVGAVKALQCRGLDTLRYALRPHLGDALPEPRGAKPVAVGTC